MLKMIIAMDKNGVIGKDGKMPWHLPNDLSYFKNMTLHHTVVMGRKTFESLGKPLPERKNIVLTMDENFSPEGVEVYRNIEEILEKAKKEHIFVIGGAVICEQFLPYTEKLYITQIESEFEGDTYFPKLNKKEWEKDSEIKGKMDEKNVYEHTFQIYLRKK